MLAPLLLAAGCTCSEEPTSKPAQAARAPSNEAAQLGPSTPTRQAGRISLLEKSNHCELHHRGLVIDWADPSTLAQQGFRLAQGEQLITTERGGTQLRRLDRPSTSLDFWWSQASGTLELSALVQAQTTERVTFRIDDRVFGTVKLKPGELQEVSLSSREFALSAGRHRVTVDLPRSRQRAPSLEIGWLRLGSSPRGKKSDQPTSRAGALSEVTIAGERKPSFVLREGSGFRCPLWLPGGGRRLVGQVGVWGNGEGEGEVVAHLDDGTEKILAQVRIAENDPRAWIPWEADLDEFSEHFLHLEWRAPRLTPGARIAFADPTVEEPPVGTESAPSARRVIVILLSGLSSDHVPPRAAGLGLSVLHQFATEATHFPGYRTTSTSSQAVVASLLSGVSPWEHGLIDQDRVWPRKLGSLAELIESQGGQTSFFTGVPTSFAAFGFDHGFQVFEQFSPIADVSALEPLRRARAWFEKQTPTEAPRFSIIHLRGGHPPFDVTREAALELPPAEYGGDLDPRRAALQMLQLRTRPRVAQRRMPEEDWIRLEALRTRALEDQSSALLSFFNSLRERGQWDDSLIVFLGDVSSGTRPQIPFDERAPLLESQLTVPLFIKFPGKYLAGRPVAGSFSPRDLFATIATALGQPAPPETIVLSSENAESRARSRPHVAYRDGHYSTRLGPYLLMSRDGVPPQLCRLDLDPSCSLDRANHEPFAVRALWLETYSALALNRQDPRIELKPDEALESALTVWGITR